MHTLRVHPIRALIALAVLAVPATVPAQQPTPAPLPPSLTGGPLTLQDAIAIAQGRGLAAEAARASRDAARERDRAFGARLLPQLSLGGQAANFDKSITPIPVPSGETQLVRQSRNISSLGLTMSQELPWTGSTLTVGSQVQRLDNFGELSGSAQPQLWTTSPLVVGLRQDLFRPRATLWNAKQQTIVQSLAERQYLEAREDVAGNVAAAFFDYYAAQVALDNQLANAAVNDTLYTLNKGRYEVGKIGENDLLQSELALLRARASLDGARLERDRTEAALKRLMNVAMTDTLRIAPPMMAPEIQADPDVAVQQALGNSSVMEQNEFDALQASRRLTEARLSNRFNATIQAQYGYNQSAPVFGDAYQALLPKQSLTMSVEMPVFQWGGGRADVEAAKMEQTRSAANSTARRAQLSEDARFAALQLTQSQRMVAISAKADTVASKRFDVAKNRYVIGKIGISDLYIAQNEKDQALQSYVQALRGYWTAYYRLRRVTLFDFEKGEVLH
jgi:outer membrane protein